MKLAFRVFCIHVLAHRSLKFSDQVVKCLTLPPITSDFLPRALDQQSSIWMDVIWIWSPLEATPSPPVISHFLPRAWDLRSTIKYRYGHHLNLKALALWPPPPPPPPLLLPYPPPPKFIAKLLWLHLYGFNLFLIKEEDLLDSKAHTYPRRRSHTIGSSNTEFHDGKKLTEPN